MTDIFKKIYKKIADWHRLEQLQDRVLVSSLNTTDLVFKASLFFFLYAVSIFVIMQTGHLQASVSLPLALIGSLIASFIAYRYGVRQYLGQGYRISRQLYTIGRKLHDIWVILALSLEVFIGYLLISSFIPGGALALTDKNYSAASGGQYVFIVGFIFVIVQPFFEGLLVRGFLSDLIDRLFNHQQSYLQFWMVVVIGTVLHAFGSLTLPVIFFSFVQAASYQYVANRYNISVSIKVNLLINVLIYSLL